MPKRQIHLYAEQLKDLIETQGLLQREVGKILRKPEDTIQQWCRKLGLKTHKTGPRKGVARLSGRFLSKGYWYIYSPNHPNAVYNKNYIAEHRLVMEAKLGRYLDKKEVVHHKDKNILNNHPDNLELFQENADHLRHELTGKCPNWTEDGKKRINAGIEQSAKNRQKAKSGGNQQLPPTDHPTL